MLENANWARYNLAVSLRKETEPSSSAMWNLNLAGEPMVDFHKFFDGENIILWIGSMSECIIWYRIFFLYTLTFD
jgi:hypothetical protein